MHGSVRPLPGADWAGCGIGTLTQMDNKKTIGSSLLQHAQAVQFSVFTDEETVLRSHRVIKAS